MDRPDHFLRCRRTFAKRTMARTRSSPVESGKASTPARLKAWLKAVSRCCAACSNAAELPVVRIHVELLARLGILHHDRADIGQLHLARVPQRTASTSWRWLSRLSGRSQPGALMKSEMTNTSERLLMVCSPRSSRMSGR